MTEERIREIHEIIWGGIVEHMEYQEFFEDHLLYSIFPPIDFIHLRELKISLIVASDKLTLEEKAALVKNSGCALCLASMTSYRKTNDLCGFCHKMGFAHEPEGNEEMNSSRFACLDGLYDDLVNGLKHGCLSQDEAIKMAEEIRDLFKNKEENEQKA